MRLLLPVRPAPRSWVRRHPCTVVAVLAFIVLGIPFCLRRDSEWEQVYVRAAERLWQGEDVYRREDGYLYPPFMAWAALPFRLLPPPAVRALWLAVNAAAVAFMLRCAWRLAGGGRLEGPAPAPRSEYLAAVLGILCGIPYLQNCFAHQQTDVVVGAVLLGGCLLLRQRQAVAAAVCFGLAAGMKCTALLWAPYFLWRRRPLAAGCVLAVAFGVNFLPDLVQPAPGGEPWLGRYASQFLRPLTAADHYVGTWGSDPVYNQSLSGAVHRWFLTTLVSTDGDLVPVPRAERIEPLVLRAVASGAGLLLLLATLWAARGPLRRLGEMAGKDRVALEGSAVLLLMLLLSPMSSKAHFGVLVLPGLCLARAALRERSPLLWTLLLPAVSLALLGNKDPLGEKLYTLTLWYGSVTGEALALLAGCLILLRRQGQAARMADPVIPAVAPGRAA
jgi:hypothetical protein